MLRVGDFTNINHLFMLHYRKDLLVHILLFKLTVCDAAIERYRVWLVAPKQYVIAASHARNYYLGIKYVNEYTYVKEYVVQSREPGIQSREPGIHSRESRIQSRDSRIQSRTSRIQSRESRIQSRESRIQSRESRIQSRDSRIQSREFIQGNP